MTDKTLMTTSNRLQSLYIVLVAFMAGLSSPVRGIEPVPVEFLWQSEPKLDYEWFRKATPPYIEMKLSHLDSAAARDRMQLTQSILRVPHSSALDRPEALRILLKRLSAGEPHERVRVEMIAAACELDNGENASQLWKLAQGNADAETIVQRACIRWGRPEPIERWRKSLASNLASEQDQLDAADGLGAAGTEEDVKLLQSIVLDATRSSSVKLSAARAIGRRSTVDQMPLARQLFASTFPYAHLLAAEVLAQSPVPGATEFMQDIATNSPDLAQRVAYRWLCERDAPAAQRLIGVMSKHADPEIRLLVLNQITSLNSDQSLPQLFEAFGDIHPKVRDAARLHVLACCTRADERMQATLALLETSIATDDWRKLEQLIRLTVELQQKSHCERLLSLIDHPRPEVCITACWALRHLADEDALLERMLAYVKRITQLLLDEDENMTEVHLQCTAHLLEAFGHRKYEPAKDTALKYVPKNFSLGLITRMAGIWTCGKLWERSENKALIQQLHERIADKATQFPEVGSLRFAATLALGWIADPDSREPLKTHDELKPTALGYATEWALKRIEEKPQP